MMAPALTLFFSIVHILEQGAKQRQETVNEYQNGSARTAASSSCLMLQYTGSFFQAHPEARSHNQASKSSSHGSLAGYAKPIRKFLFPDVVSY
jgi:hypothetical protein